MASSAHLETPPNVWEGLARLRDISRLVLVAIQRDDLEALHHLAQEGNALAESLRASLLDSDLPTLPDDVTEQLREFAEMNGSIVEQLEMRRDEVRAELSELRATRGRLRAVKLHDAPEASCVDRNT